MTYPVRRIVTGHDAEGRSSIVEEPAAGQDHRAGAPDTGRR